MEITVDNIVAINKQILRGSVNEGISVNKDELKKILEEADEQETIIDKAVYILAAIPWAQPFSGGNKRTAITAATIVLMNNGYSFNVESKNDIEFLRKLLFEIQEERSELNVRTFSKISLYVRNRIEKI